MSQVRLNDALTEAGTLLGHGGGAAFLMEREDEIVEAHGQDAFDDLLEVARGGGIDAALRFAGAVAPWGEFDAYPLRGGTAVDYSAHGISGRATFRSPDDAVAVAATAIALRENLLNSPVAGRIVRSEQAAAELRNETARPFR